MLYAGCGCLHSQNSKASRVNATGTSLASHMESSFCRKAVTEEAGVKNTGSCTLMPRRRVLEPRVPTVLMMLSNEAWVIESGFVGDHAVGWVREVTCDV